MKSSNKNLLNLLAFVALIIIAVLEIFSILAHFDILTIGGIIANLLNTIKNVCVCIVIGYLAFGFVSGKKKGWVITFWVALGIVVVCSILMWIK